MTALREAAADAAVASPCAPDDASKQAAFDVLHDAVRREAAEARMGRIEIPSICKITPLRYEEAKIPHLYQGVPEPRGDAPAPRRTGREGGVRVCPAPAVQPGLPLDWRAG